MEGKEETYQIRREGGKEGGIIHILRLARVSRRAVGRFLPKPALPGLFGQDFVAGF